MKKIIPFLLFPPLLIGVIFLGFNQYKYGGNKNTTERKVQDNDRITTPVISDSVQPTSTISKSEKIMDEINLTISSPDANATTENSTVTVIGSTEPGASVAINDNEVVASSDGSFKSIIQLDEGENYISVVAYNDSGNVAERELLVTRAVSGL